MVPFPPRGASLLGCLLAQTLILTLYFCFYPFLRCFLFMKFGRVSSIKSCILGSCRLGSGLKRCTLKQKERKKKKTDERKTNNSSIFHGLHFMFSYIINIYIIQNMVHIGEANSSFTISTKEYSKLRLQQQHKL